jgi:DNA-binding transcriptional LysR family regulator
MSRITREFPTPSIDAGPDVMPHMPDFEAWAIFAKVAEKGSFSRAAAELGLSHATVSKAVSRLEDRMRTTLFNRTTRQLALTESGRISLDRAKRILADGLAVEEEMSDEAEVPRGFIRLAVTVAFGIANVAPILPEFLHQHPEVELDLHVTDHPIDLVADGFDIAIRFGPVADLSVRITRLLSLRVPLVGAPAYFAKHGRPTHPSDLARHEALIFSHIVGASDWDFVHPVEGHHTVHMDGRMHVNNGIAIIPAITAGIGLAALPEVYIWRELKDGQVEEVLTDWVIPPIPLNMLTPPGRAHPARVRALMDFLKRKFAAMPWAQD